MCKSLCGLRVAQVLGKRGHIAGVASDMHSCRSCCSTNPVTSSNASSAASTPTRLADMIPGINSLKPPRSTLLHMPERYFGLQCMWPSSDVPPQVYLPLGCSPPHHPPLQSSGALPDFHILSFCPVSVFIDLRLFQATWDANSGSDASGIGAVKADGLSWYFISVISRIRSLVIRAHCDVPSTTSSPHLTSWNSIICIQHNQFNCLIMVTITVQCRNTCDCWTRPALYQVRLH